MLRDYSGANNHGTLTNMDIATDWTPSNGGQVAVDFGGTDDYVAFTKPGDLLQGSSKFTIACWTYSRTTGPGGNGRFWQQEANNIRVIWDTGLKFWFGGVNSPAASGSTGSWMHVAAVYDQVNILIYTDGTPGTATATTTSITIIPTDFRIGNRSGLDRGHDGLIDDFRVYNRALSPGEVRMLARRRGIAYDRQPVRHRAGSAGAPASSTSGNLLLLGVG